VRRISFWFLSTLSAVVLLVGFDASRHGASVTATGPITSGSTGGSTDSGGSGRTSGQGPSGRGSSSSPPSRKAPTTRTVTGAVAQTVWGPVQVQIKVAAGTITGVRILQYPSGNAQDVAIAQYALPVLMRETTRAQSAQIDMVSGATYTSQGYLQSLQSALDQANL
jgi:uncharacterized protein with FMN-binding domain